MSSDDEQYDDNYEYGDEEVEDEGEAEGEEEEGDDEEVEEKRPTKKGKERRPRRKKDPNRPRGALTPYMCFSKQVRPAVMQQHPNAAVTEIAKLIGAKWRMLSQDEKQPFIDMAKADRARYKAAMQNYVPTPGYEEGGRRRKKAKKDPNAPKKPKSAYFLYAETRRDILRGQHPDARISEIAKITGEEWRNLSDAQKQPFYQRAEALKNKYEQEVAAYKDTL
eukprot:m.29258 g.29258  ORF g.29258 m.29258 type:complete len:222 (-) comp10517_c0_seq1:588-1253(-)